MRIDVSRRVRLYVLGGVGAGIVFEEREDGQRVPVHILRGPQAARRWTESYYQGVEWETPHRATALIGSLSRPARTSPPVGAAGEGRDREHRPLTYETAELRTYLPELVAGADGPVILQQCEEHVAEVDQWEPFTNVLWEAGSG